MLVIDKSSKQDIEELHSKENGKLKVAQKCSPIPIKCKCSVMRKFHESDLCIRIVKLSFMNQGTSLSKMDAEKNYRKDFN